MENVLGVFLNDNFFPIPCLRQVIFLALHNENLVEFLEVKPVEACGSLWDWGLQEYLILNLVHTDPPIVVRITMWMFLSAYDSSPF